MKKLSWQILIAVCLIVLPTLALAKKETVIIGPVLISPEVIALAEKEGKKEELFTVARSLSAQFIPAIAAINVLDIVERSRKDVIELEQDFASVAVDPDDKFLAKSGKMAGAKYVFLPQIDGFYDNVEITEHTAIQRKSLKREVFLSAIVQVVDTTTGKVLPSAVGVQMLEKEEFRSAINPQSGQQILLSLSNKMARSLAQGSVAGIYPAKVLTVSGNKLMFNRGLNAGFSDGDLVGIYTAQEVLDEDSGAILYNEMLIGRAVISRAEKAQAYASIKEDFGILKGCIVRKDNGVEAQPTKEPAVSPGSSERPVNW
ncbi:MAG: CsgG/HfaB family protein [Deltaproteobacteria bacterium]|nr:CsgG/HfaB family protein [Deltaproteobacteria bacterium]